VTVSRTNDRGTGAVPWRDRWPERAGKVAQGLALAGDLLLVRVVVAAACHRLPAKAA